jgi:hypothetical protein
LQPAAKNAIGEELYIQEVPVSLLREGIDTPDT